MSSSHFDHRFSPTWLMGGGLGSSMSTYELDDDQSKGQVKSKIATLFGRWQHQDWYVDSAMTFFFDRIRASRLDESTGTKASNTHNGYHLAPTLGVVYKGFSWKGREIEPHASATLLYGSENGYTEEGAGAANQKVKDRSATSGRRDISVILRKRVEHPFGKATYELGLGALVHEPLRKGKINGTAGGAGFDVDLNESRQVYGQTHLAARLHQQRLVLLYPYHLRNRQKSPLYRCLPHRRKSALGKSNNRFGF